MLSFRIIPYGNGQRLMIVRDVSDLRRLETARRDFVANASHELRTPLTVLRGYLDVMEPETRNGGSLEEWSSPMSEMRAQASRMEALINDLLKLARLEANIINTRQDLLDVPKMLARTQEQAKSMSRRASTASSSTSSRTCASTVAIPKPRACSPTWSAMPCSTRRPAESSACAGGAMTAARI